MGPVGAAESLWVRACSVQQLLSMLNLDVLRGVESEGSHPPKL